MGPELTRMLMLWNAAENRYSYERTLLPGEDQQAAMESAGTAASTSARIVHISAYGPDDNVVCGYSQYWQWPGQVG